MRDFCDSDIKRTASEQNALRELPLNSRQIEQASAVACNPTLPAGAQLRSHLPAIMTSPAAPSSLFAAYADALARLRQLHAMCTCATAAAAAPFPLPLPEPAAYYVTKMAAAAGVPPPVQPFDPRWASCRSPPMAPNVRHPTSGGGHVGSRGACRDFSIPSILSRAGPSSTGADSDATTESEERCRSTSSSLDDTEQQHLMTSRQNVVTSYAHADLMDRRRECQRGKQQFECPQCDKVRIAAEEKHHHFIFH